jgi:hypothetical protein
VSGTQFVMTYIPALVMAGRSGVQQRMEAVGVLDQSPEVGKGDDPLG